MQVLLGISQPHKDQSHNSQISVKKKKKVTNFNWIISLHGFVLAHIFKNVSVKEKDLLLDIDAKINFDF